MSISHARVVSWSSQRTQARAFTGISCIALALAVVIRMRLDMRAPLWLDESWTGAFASQSSPATLFGQIRDDANAPGYYVLIWAWARLFGISNIALHVPSLIFGLVTPGIAWAGFRSERPILALTWAVLLATWIPGIDQSGEARCYAMLLCAAALSMVAHVRLLEGPSGRRALVWATCATSMTLVHYYAGMLALAQGLAFLVVHRERALRFWPAALAFVPAFGWIAWHAPRLADFARPDVAWYEPLRMTDLPVSLVVLAGGPLTLLSFVAALAIGALVSERSGTSARQSAHRDTALLWSGGAALAATVLCLILGVIRPTFTDRYLTPFVPGVSMLAAVWVIRIGRKPRLASGILLTGSLAAMVFTLIAGSDPLKRLYSFEAASAWLAEVKPSRLVLFWDHPATPVEAPDQLDAVGGFFLRRAGLNLDVAAVFPTSADMNGPILDAASRDSMHSDAAVLWLYDTLIHHTTARNHPPRLASLDPGLECRDFGAFNVGVLACRRRPLP